MTGPWGGPPSPSGRIRSQRPDSSATASLPPDPDFSYLSEVVATLPFVQKIRAAIAQAAALDAAATSTGGATTFTGQVYLTPRSSLLQNTFQSAWGWMMGDASQVALPLAMNYSALGSNLKIYDTFASTAADAFTSADLTTMKQFLNLVPPSLLQNITDIVNGPVTEEAPGAGSITGGSQISIEGAVDINAANLSHEIGWTVFGSDLFLQGPRQQWDALWNDSTDPVWDTADPFSNFPPRPMPANQPIPFGGVEEGEDFASVFNDWLNDSATPRLNLNQSSSILEQAVYAAFQGHTIILQKTLLMASLFTNLTTQQLSLYNWQGFVYGNTIEKQLSTVQSSPTALILGDYTSTVQNGQIGAVTSPAKSTYGSTPNVNTFNYTFPTPVPIPAFAAGIWGITLPSN